MVLAGLGARVDGQLERILALAAEHLEMDFAFVADAAPGRPLFQFSTDVAAVFGLAEDELTAWLGTCSQLMLAGEIPPAVPDVAADSRVRCLVSASQGEIGAYICVPITLSDGTVFGSLGCLNRDPHVLGERDVRFMQMLAEMAGPEIEGVREQEQARARISKLIDQSALDIALQPVFDVHDGHCLGVEALSRFPATYGHTDEVFECAHSVGLGLQLETLALTHAVRLLPALDRDQFLAVNLTPQVAFELSATGAAHPEILPRLVLEITEHAAVDSYARLRRALRPSRELGLRLAIDDAGAGYASLKHVVELEPDVIKIDRSLIDGLAGDRARRSVVSAFVLLAIEMGASVIAEGVEQAADLEAIRDLGVDAAQGYLAARPTTDRNALAYWQTVGADVWRASAVKSSLIIAPR
jgi:EAL domain-containing protein (putative c-di-GMP-specific phosphodiesterase class I)